MRRVLVVDDEPGMRLAIKEALTRKGYEVGLAANGIALEKRAFHPHLTLARLKGPLSRPPDWGKIRAGLPSSWPAWPVGEVRIIESTLTPSGPEYKTLAHCPLKPESAVEIGGDG